VTCPEVWAGLLRGAAGAWVELQLRYGAGILPMACPAVGSRALGHLLIMR
jgi:hypothetical protein